MREPGEEEIRTKTEESVLWITQVNDGVSVLPWPGCVALSESSLNASPPPQCKENLLRPHGEWPQLLLAPGCENPAVPSAEAFVLNPSLQPNMSRRKPWPLYLPRACALPWFLRALRKPCCPGSLSVSPQVSGQSTLSPACTACSPAFAKQGPHWPLLGPK